MGNFETDLKRRPHLVILGAGASVAAIPNGDANKKKISVMSGFIDKLGMRNILDKAKISTKSDNLEDIFSGLYDKNETKVLYELEESIYKFFQDYELPNIPTIYDLLILSLREKDLIATFNWDPMLTQAYRRVRGITKKLPGIIFLHGNVSTGVCYEHERIGPNGQSCSICGRPYVKLYA